MRQDKQFYLAKDIATLLDVSNSTAYRIIKGLNEEMKMLGYMTINGRVNRRFFEEKFYLTKSDED